jgi:hypothetical protein
MQGAIFNTQIYNRALSATEVMQNYMGEDGLAQSYANSAAIPITQMYIPATNEPLHPNMASRPDPFPKAKKSLYFNEDTPFTEDDVV